MTIGATLQRQGLNNEEILQLFKNAQDDLLRIVDRADPTRPFGIYRTQALREIENVIRQLEAKIGVKTEREIKMLYTAGAKETATKIKDFGETAFAFAFAGVNQNAVDVLTGGALNDFGNTILALRRDSTKALFDKKKLQDKIIEGVIQGSSVYRTQTQLMNALKSNGITALKAKNGFGRRYSVEDYTNILVRSQSMAAYNIGAKTTMLDSGRRFAKIATLRPDLDGEDICNEFERQIYIDLKDPKQLPPFHPRCRHVPIPVSFEELKANRPDLYAKATAFFRQAAD